MYIVYGVEIQRPAMIGGRRKASSKFSALIGGHNSSTEVTCSETGLVLSAGLLQQLIDTVGVVLAQAHRQMPRDFPQRAFLDWRNRGSFRAFPTWGKQTWSLDRAVFCATCTNVYCWSIRTCSSNNCTSKYIIRSLADLVSLADLGSLADLVKSG
jgi:hypothetical protein